MIFDNICKSCFSASKIIPVRLCQWGKKNSFFLWYQGRYQFWSLPITSVWRNCILVCNFNSIFYELFNLSITAIEVFVCNLFDFVYIFARNKIFQLILKTWNWNNNLSFTTQNGRRSHFIIIICFLHFNFFSFWTLLH